MAPSMSSCSSCACSFRPRNLPRSDGQLTPLPRFQFTCPIKVEHWAERPRMSVEEELHFLFAHDVITTSDQPEVVAQLRDLVGRGDATQPAEPCLRKPLEGRPHHLVSNAADVQNGPSRISNPVEYQLYVRWRHRRQLSVVFVARRCGVLPVSKWWRHDIREETMSRVVVVGHNGGPDMEEGVSFLYSNHAESSDRSTI